MEAHPFLSPAWIVAAKSLRDEYTDRIPRIEFAVIANITIFGSPFEEPRIEGHVDTSAGTLVIDEGLLDRVDLTAEIPYELARKLFVERDAQAAMQAFWGGQIRLTGDSAKLLQLPLPSSSTTPSPLAIEIARRVDKFTLGDPPGSS